VSVVSTGVWIALVAAVAALAFGGYRALADGRFRRSRSTGSEVVSEPEGAGARAESGAESGSPDGSVWDVVAGAAGVELGERATLVQFSSAFCAPCRVTRGVLDDVAGAVPGVVYVDIDAEQHLDVVRRLDIRRTPTTIVLDSGGREVARAAGAPRRDQVLRAIPPRIP